MSFWQNHRVKMFILNKQPQKNLVSNFDKSSDLHEFPHSLLSGLKHSFIAYFLDTTTNKRRLNLYL